MKYLFLLCIFVLFSPKLHAQASGSTDFSVEIELLAGTTVDDYEFYIAEMSGINSIVYCSFKVDSLKNSVHISGHLSYIVNADILELVIEHKSSAKYIKQKQYYASKTHFFVTLYELYHTKSQLNTIHLNSQRPYYKLTGEFIESKFEIRESYDPYSNDDEQHIYNSIINQNWIQIPQAP